ncbi:MAG: M23 family metallopeptidase [Oscillospiraceae bacterium]|nr:M23 family metallopeptidase [Oscillospiraceae bacterium]
MVDPGTLTMAAKAAAAVLQNEKTRKILGWIIAAILSPLLLLLILLSALLAGGASHNTAALKLCFEDGAIPPAMPMEYRARIQEMRESFSLLEKEAEKLNDRMENSLDTVRIQAVFYALYFGGEHPSRQLHRQFADCFVRQEERTRIIVTVDEEGNEFETEESYTVTMPIESLEEVYRNLSARMGLDIFDEQKNNADSIYNIVRFGYAGGESVTDAPFIGADGFCSPIGENWRTLVTSEFGLRADPFTGKRKGHTGLDLAVPNGTPIRAALPGTVRTAAYNQGGYGYYVLIDHADGLSTLYAHSSRLLVRAGEAVEAGDVIALSGSTGRSTGPHLHFKVHINGERTNPRSYLP